MTSKMPYQCGNCEREFYMAYKLEEHICKEKLSFLEKIKEWRDFRNVPETEKFILEVGHTDQELGNKLWGAYQAWEKGIPPSASISVKENIDPIGGSDDSGS